MHLRDVGGRGDQPGADRPNRLIGDRYVGDPDFVDNPVSKLLDKNYARQIRDSIDPYRAGVSKELMPKGFGESHETTHYSIIDNDGNAVAVTYTLNGSFGAGVVAPGTGILLNNEMDDFSAKAGVPNAYGLGGGDANAVGPLKRPLGAKSRASSDRPRR